MIEFKYNVITRENSEQYALSPEWWNRHPDWNFFVRTDVRYSKNARIWLSGGGRTLEDALKMATESVQVNFGTATRLVKGCFIMGPSEARGILTDDIIKHD